MTVHQIGLFAVLGGVLLLLLWGRIRHDLVAATALFVAVLAGLVPEGRAFSGFSNPAVLIVALVLIASRAFENSGALSVLADRLIRPDRPIYQHVAITGGFAAALSAIINNVATLALLMPLDLEAARRAGRPAGQTLMPLAFCTILGGMITLIGTPPNIIASSMRAERMGEPFSFFDFAPVGIAVASAGLLFVAAIGWRLVPSRQGLTGERMHEASFKAELAVPDGSPSVGRLVADLDEDAEEADIVVLGAIIEGRRHVARARAMTLQAGDILVVEGSGEAIGEFIKKLKLQEPQEEKEDGDEAGEPDEAEEAETDTEETVEPSVVQAVVLTDSRLAGRSAREMMLRSSFGLSLLGIARAGEFFRNEVRDRRIVPGDVLLIATAVRWWRDSFARLGLMVIDRISVAPIAPLKILITVGLFVAAIVAAALGLTSFTVAIAIAVAGYGAAGLIPARDFYRQVDWSVIVMLACLLPLGEAFDRLGGTGIVADALLFWTEGPSPVLALALVMAIVMTLSDLLNNVATMVIAGPLAMDIAAKLDANPDTFLMGAAVATSCAFLTPIGHKNNTLIMGPGAFRFSDYWRMGLPLELLVLAVSIPALLIFWPL